jgi:hypothetical protein
MSQTQTSGWNKKNRRNTLKLMGWTFAWVTTMAIATFGPLLVWESKTLSLGSILLNLAAGAGMIVANKNYLMGVDEMQRRIQLEAMALALGVALVFGLAYSTADIADLIPFDAEIAHVVFAVCAAYGLGIFIGNRRFQ